MKKIILLTLLSVFFLSAFCQTPVNSEIITKINITRNIDDTEEVPEIERGFWIFFYNSVHTEYLPEGGVVVACFGWGLKMCLPSRGTIVTLHEQYGTIMEQTCTDILSESDSRLADGEIRGSISRKVSIPRGLALGNDSYLLFQMNWENDPQKPYNGRAEIIISKISNFGL